MILCFLMTWLCVDRCLVGEIKILEGKKKEKKRGSKRYVDSDEVLDSPSPAIELNVADKQTKKSLLMELFNATGKAKVAVSECV